MKFVLGASGRRIGGPEVVGMGVLVGETTFAITPVGVRPVEGKRVRLLPICYLQVEQGYLLQVFFLGLLKQ